VFRVSILSVLGACSEATFILLRAIFKYLHSQVMEASGEIVIVKLLNIIAATNMYRE
jgi:hypothetical protein